ncbi:hypothetical protein Bca4012_078375 [Brassica carinata]
MALILLCFGEALYSHGRRRWETSSVGLNGRGIDVYLCSYLAISVDYAGFVWLLLIDTSDIGLYIYVYHSASLNAEFGHVRSLANELYVNISWPLYQNMFMLLRFTHTWAPKNLAYGHEVPRVVSSLSEEEQDALMKNIRRRTTPQPIKSLLISN